MTDTKTCAKGYSCGSACIEKKDDCTKGLSPASAELANKFADMIRTGKANKENKKEASFLDSINEAEALLARGDALSNDNIDNLKRAASEQGDFVKLVTGNSGKNVMSDEELQEFSAAVVYSLPASLQKSIGTNGSPGQIWVGRDEAGNDLFKPRSQATALEIRDRAKEVVKLYVKQGGIDAYTLGKEPLSLFDMDVEHVRPLADFAKGDTKAVDSPDNWLLVRGGLNKLRGNTNLVEFAKQANEWASLTPEQKQAKAAASNTRKLGSAAAKKAEYTKVLGTDSTIADGGKALEAQTVHQLGAKTWLRPSKSIQSAGRGAATMPAELRRELIRQAMELRQTTSADAPAGYSPKMSKEDFQAYYQTNFAKVDKIIAKQRAEAHEAGIDMTPYLQQDELTKIVGQEILGPVREANNKRVTDFVSNGKSYDETTAELKESLKSILSKRGASEESINNVLSGI